MTHLASLLLLPATCLAYDPMPQDPEPVPKVVNSIGMEFRLIPAGSFDMGSWTGELDERPVHRVTLDAFYIGVHEVTQEQYERVMGENPSTFKGAKLPVEHVSWIDAVAFCRRLSKEEGVEYRLPTEAEWVYAARGGLKGKEYVWGDNKTPVIDGVKQGNVPDESFWKKYGERAEERTYFNGYDDGFVHTSPVGTFAPNGYGLYDMAGNVFEWCSDRYQEFSYPSEPVVNPPGPTEGRDRVMRGGPWCRSRRFQRVAGRFRDRPTLRAPAVGFRCVREIPEGR